jgi:hypothetical protein
LIGWAWLHYASAAGMHNYVQVRWFDKAKVYISTTDLYNSTANPTSAVEFIRGAIPPATAQYYKLRIIGGYTDTDIAGTAYFDGFREVHPLVYAQDHKTIAEAFLSNWGIWTEKGSVSVNLPPLSSNCYVRLYFTGELKTLYPTTGVSSKIRFRMGGVYSGEFEVVNNTSYQKSLFSITLPRGVSGAQTLYMELLVEYAADGCYGRKSDPIVAIEILIP